MQTYGPQTKGDQHLGIQKLLPESDTTGLRCYIVTLYLAFHLSIEGLQITEESPHHQSSGAPKAPYY